MVEVFKKSIFDISEDELMNNFKHTYRLKQLYNWIFNKNIYDFQ